MIGAERRRIALGVVASLALHALALAALAARSTDRLVVAAAEERVLEVTWWPGADGQAASVASPMLRTEEPTEAAPEATIASPSAAPIAPVPDEEPPAATASAAKTPRPAVADAEKPRPARASEPRRDAPAARPRSTDRRLPPTPRTRDAERPDRRVAVTGTTPTPTSAMAEGGRPGAPGPRGGGGSASDLAAYLASVRARIASRQPAGGGEQGRVGIRFDVSADGSFSGVTAVAGDRGPLADAALRIVRRASPAPPIPPTLGRGTLAMTLTIVFD